MKACMDGSIELPAGLSIMPGARQREALRDGKAPASGHQIRHADTALVSKGPDGHGQIRAQPASGDTQPDTEVGPHPGIRGAEVVVGVGGRVRDVEPPAQPVYFRALPADLPVEAEMVAPLPAGPQQSGPADLEASLAHEGNGRIEAIDHPHPALDAEVEASRSARRLIAPSRPREQQDRENQ
jgi:hypothetical protein